MSNKENEPHKFDALMKKNALDHMVSPTEKEFEEVLKKENLENLIKVYRVHFIEEDGKITPPIAEFDTAEERNQWDKVEGKKIRRENKGRGCLMFNEGPPEIIEIGKIEERPEDLK